VRLRKKATLGTAAFQRLRQKLLEKQPWHTCCHVPAETKWLDRGDQIFAGGVTQAYLQNAKQFNQNYRWSFDYIAWRNKTGKVLVAFDSTPATSRSTSTGGTSGETAGTTRRHQWVRLDHDSDLRIE
jgi:hypothetical protein